jgi:hypothetical protein
VGKQSKEAEAKEEKQDEEDGAEFTVQAGHRTVERAVYRAQSTRAGRQANVGEEKARHHPATSTDAEP